MNTGDISKLVTGESGVFKFEVTNKEEAPALDNYATYANALQAANAATVANGVVNALIEKAEIEDNRSIFY